MLPSVACPRTNAVFVRTYWDSPARSCLNLHRLAWGIFPGTDAGRKQNVVSVHCVYLDDLSSVVLSLCVIAVFCVINVGKWIFKFEKSRIQVVNRAFSWSLLLELGSHSS